MTQIVGKRGIPVLAYPISDSASPVSLSLVFRCNESRAQATLALQSSIFLDSFDDAQTFILQYDADNIVPGTTSLGPAAIDLPQTRLDEIARPGRAQIRTLSLTLKSSCPIWCPPSGYIAPKAGFDAPFNQLANLANAKKLHILFDYNWLRHETHAIFQRLVEHPEQLSGFPVGRYYAKHFRRVDASVFKIREDVDAHIETDATTEDEEPPPYAEASSKRPRHVSTSLAPSSPTPKRVLLSPCPEYIPTSPTEKDSTAGPSPKPPCSPAALAPEHQEAVNIAISKFLPSVLEALLPTLPPHLSTAPSPPSPSASSQPPIPPPPALSTLGILLSEHVARRIEAELATIYAHTLSHAAYLRNTADVEFFEELEDRRLDLAMTKEDGIAELDRVADDKLEVFREECEDVVEHVEERVQHIADLACDFVSGEINARVNKEREVLGRERGWLGWEREVLERDRRALEKEKEVERCELVGRGARAGSAPL